MTKAKINFLISIILFSVNCASQFKDYLQIKNFENFKTKSKFVSLSENDEIDLYLNGSKDFITHIDEVTEVEYKYNGDSKYSITLRTEQNSFLLDSILCAKPNLKELFLNGNYFVYIRKLVFKNQDYFFIAYGARSYNSSKTSSFQPIIINISKKILKLIELKGFVYNTNTNLIVAKNKNEIIFLTYDLDKKKIWLLELEDSKITEKVVYVESLYFNSTDQSIILSAQDYLKLKIKM